MHVKPPGFDPLPTLPTPVPGPVPGRGSAGFVGRPDAGPMPAVTPRSASSPLESALQDAAAATADPVHIHPLDIAGALKILIAEVRAALPLPGVSEPTPETTPQTVVQMLLQALPAADAHGATAWLAAANQVEAAVQVALDGAVAAVAAWRDVPAAVVDGGKDIRDVVVAAVTDDPLNPLWVRPEWVGLAPAMQRYWRRRRVARQRLRDPDPHWHEVDDAIVRDDAIERQPRDRSS